MSPRVSVVMAVHNGLPFLRQAVESILHQTLGDLEFVIVDDGSQDGTWEALQRWAATDSRIRLLRNQRNLGVAEARNRGIAAASADYLACQDADDESHPRRLELQADFLDAHPEVGLLAAFPELVDERGVPLASDAYPRLVDNDRLQAQLLESNCLCAGSVAFRAGVLRLVGGYDQTLAPSEDYDLWLRMAEVTHIACLPDALYRYRQHDSSASAQQRALQMRNKAVALERALLRRYAGHPPTNLKRSLAKDFVRGAYLAHVAGEGSAAAELLARASEHAPSVFVLGEVVEEVIDHYLKRETVADPFGLAESLFSQLFPPTTHMKRLKARTLGRLHMAEFFEAAEQEHPNISEWHLLAGLRADPRWLLNRGVWAIGLRRRLRHSGLPSAAATIRDRGSD